MLNLFRSNKGLFFLMLLSCSSAFAIGNPEVDALKLGMPQDVALIIDRTVACNRWVGEESTNKAKADKIKANLEKWGCATLDADQEKIFKTYKTNYEVKGRIEKAKGIF